MKIILANLFLIIGLFSYSQKEPSIQITNYKYDNENNLISEVKPFIEIKYEYNAKNQMSKIVSRYDERIRTTIIEYEDDKKSLEYTPYLKVNYYYTNGKLARKIDSSSYMLYTYYEYKKNGDTISIKSYSDSLKINKKEITKFSYQPKKNEYQKSTKSFRDDYVITFVRYFNENRKIEKLTSILNDEKEELREQYFYDENQNLITQDDIYSNAKYLYKYMNENLVKQSKYSLSENQLLEKIEFNYDTKNRLISKKVSEYNMETVINIDE